jgi:hypothetical protein
MLEAKAPVSVTSGYTVTLVLRAFQHVFAKSTKDEFRELEVGQVYFSVLLIVYC